MVRLRSSLMPWLTGYIPKRCRSDKTNDAERYSWKFFITTGYFVFIEEKMIRHFSIIYMYVYITYMYVYKMLLYRIDQEIMLTFLIIYILINGISIIHWIRLIFYTKTNNGCYRFTFFFFSFDSKIFYDTLYLYEWHFSNFFVCSFIRKYSLSNI